MLTFGQGVSTQRDRAKWLDVLGASGNRADLLKRAGRKQKLKKASGTDEIPDELWRVILEDDRHVVFDWILKLVSSLWEGSQMPAELHISRVIALYRKDDLGDCLNYRPIPSINVG